MCYFRHDLENSTIKYYTYCGNKMTKSRKGGIFVQVTVGLMNDPR